MMLHAFAQHWLVKSLGWTLLHFCWQGIVIAAILWCALQLLANRPAQARYLAACAALALIVLLPLATFTRVALVEHRLTASTGIAEAPSITIQAGIGVAATPWLNRVAATLDPALPWLLLAYFAGAAIFLLRLSVGFSVTRRIRFMAVSAVPADLEATFDALRQRLGIARAVTLMHSALVQVPTVIGWLRPIVLVPAGCFLGLSATQLEAILSHELAHIRRHDYFVSVLQSVVEALLFYHPAVWWVSRQIRRERECCCDDLAVSIGGDALAYARALSTLEANRSTYPQFILGANGGVLTMRIQRLLRTNENASASQAAAVVVLALLSLSAVAIANTTHVQASQSIVTPLAPLPPVAPLAPLPPPPPQAALPPVKPLAPIAPLPALDAQTTLPAHPPVFIDPLPPQAAQQTQNGPIKVAGGVIAGQIVSKAQPIYPPEAKAAHISGAVVLKALISKEGEITSLQLISGPPELVPSAMDAVRQWKYKPYLLNGEPTEVETTITVNYHFGGEDNTPPPTAQNDAPDAVVKHIGGAVSRPEVVYAPEPRFTAEQRKAKVAGNVLVALQVDPQGRPIKVHAIRSTDQGLTENAIKAVKQYKFKPALENGHPVAVEMNVEVNFQVF